MSMWSADLGRGLCAGEEPGGRGPPIYIQAFPRLLLFSFFDAGMAPVNQGGTGVSWERGVYISILVQYRLGTGTQALQHALRKQSFRKLKTAAEHCIRATLGASKGDNARP